MTDLNADDVAELKRQGDFEAFLAQIAGKAPPKAESAATPTEPGYHIPRRGAWPCGTAASGPTPRPCNDCQPKGTP